MIPPYLTKSLGPIPCEGFNHFQWYHFFHPYWKRGLSCPETFVALDHLWCKKQKSIKQYNKCSDRSAEVLLPTLSGNYDRPINQPANPPKDRPGHTEVTLPIISVVIITFFKGRLWPRTMSRLSSIQVGQQLSSAQQGTYNYFN